MKRENFKKVVKAFSAWKIDKRKGNYILPNGERLQTYLKELTEKLLQNNDLAFAKNGNVYEVFNVDNRKFMFVPFGTDEKIEEQEERIKNFVIDLLF